MNKYFKLFDAVASRTDLTGNDKVIFAFLTSLTNSKKYTFVKNSFIADRTGTSKITVKRSLKKLKDKKMILIINSNKFRKIQLLEKYNFIEFNEKPLDPDIDEALNKLFKKL